MKKYFFVFFSALTMLMFFSANQAIAQTDDFTEDELSPIEKLAYEQNTGELRAFGVGSQSTNITLALQSATAVATANLRTKIQNYVEYGLKTYLDQVGVDDQLSVDERTRIEVTEAAKGVTEGITTLDSRRLSKRQGNRKIYIYEVCVKYDRASLLDALAKQMQGNRILANEKQFREDMQSAWDALDAYNGDVSLAEQQAARANEMDQANKDRQAARDMRAKQQDADNSFRERQSNENYNLESQAQFQKTAKEMQKQEIDGEIQKSNARNQEIKRNAN